MGGDGRGRIGQASNLCYSLGFRFRRCVERGGGDREGDGMEQRLIDPLTAHAAERQRTPDGGGRRAGGASTGSRPGWSLEGQRGQRGQQEIGRAHV